MKYVIKSITAIIPKGDGSEETYSFPIIPASGILSIKTSSDALTEEINLSSKLKWNDTRPPQLTMDMTSVSVVYDKDGTNGTLTFGSAELPVRFQVTDNSVRTVSCTYKREV